MSSRVTYPRHPSANSPSHLGGHSEGRRAIGLPKPESAKLRSERVKTKASDARAETDRWGHKGKLSHGKYNLPRIPQFPSLAPCARCARARWRASGCGPMTGGIGARRLSTRSAGGSRSSWSCSCIRNSASLYDSRGCDGGASWRTSGPDETV
jgi:hypothetical protein